MTSLAKLGIITECRYVRGDDGQVYAVGALTYDVLKSYLAFAGEVLVFARVRHEARPSGELASGEGVQFIELPWYGGGVEFLTNVAKIAKILRRNLRLCDALVIRVPSQTGLLAGLYWARTRRPWVVEVMGCARDSFVHHGSKVGRVLGPSIFHATRTLVRQAPAVVYVTERFLQDRYPTSGLTLACSDIRTRPAVIKERHAIARPVTLGLIGQVEGRVKGIDTAIEALSLMRSGKGETLRILGRGDPSALQSLARRLGVGDRVSFDGTRTSGSGVYEWLNELDLYLQPSRTEGLPRATIEAILTGVPVIASDVGGLPELVPSEALHEPGNAQAMAELLDRFVGDADWRSSLTAETYRRAESFDPIRLSARWRAFMEAALCTGVSTRSE